MVEEDCGNTGHWNPEYEQPADKRHQKHQGPDEEVEECKEYNTAYGPLSTTEQASFGMP